MKTIASYLPLICMCLAKSSADLASEHSFFTPLDEDQKVKLYWNISTANKEIYFTVEAQTTGWVGFGISSGQGKMKGADIVIGWVKDGKPYFKVRKKCVRRFTLEIFALDKRDLASYAGVTKTKTLEN